MASPSLRRLLALSICGIFRLVAFGSSLAGCHWTTPQVENAFSNLRVDVIKNDAPNFTVLVHNNSPDNLQVIIRSTASKTWSPDKSHEERFVLEPQGGNSFPVPINTKQVKVVEARPTRY
jgi:hypothetical protein